MITEAQDPRFENLVKITDPSPRGRNRAIGVWPGPAGTAQAMLMRTAVTATETLLRNAHDIRGNRNFGPVEAGQRLREASAPTLKALNDTAVKLQASREQIDAQLSRLSPVKTYGELPAYQVTLDLRLLDNHNAKVPAERAAIEDQLANAPYLQLNLGEAIMRLPSELAPISKQARNDLRTGLLKFLKPAEYGALQEQSEQQQVAENTLLAGVEIVRDTTGSVTDLMTHAPVAFAFSNGRAS